MSLKTRMSLDEFMRYAEEHNSVLFNSAQRTLESRLRFSDAGKKLYGLDEQEQRFRLFLKGASQNKAERAKIWIAVGPAGSGKNEYVKNVEEGLRRYSATEEGTIYKAKLYMDTLVSPKLREFFDSDDDQKKFANDVKNQFGDLNKVLLSLGNNMQSSLYLFLKREDGVPGATKVEELVGKVNEKTTEYWRRITLDKDAASSTIEHVKGVLMEALEKHMKDPSRLYEALEKTVVIEKNTPQDMIVASQPPVSQSNKDLDFKGIFGGKTDYAILSKLGASNTSPLTLLYGIAGGQNMPSPSGGLLVLSEMLKADESFINTSLDFIQDRRVTFTPAYKESFDVVAMGSGNLDELPNLKAKIKSYLMSRLEVVPFPYMTKRSDMKKALEEIYTGAKKELEIHLSPRFTDMLSLLFVEASIENYTNLPLKVNAEMHDGAPHPDLQMKITLEEILRAANSKPITERKEGMTLGVPYRHISSSPKEFTVLAKSATDKLKDGEKHQLCLDAIFNDSTPHALEDFLNTMSDVTEETRGRLRTKITPTDGEGGNLIVQDVWNEYRKKVSRDVTAAYMGSAAVDEKLASYVRQVYYLTKGSDKYKDDDGRYRSVNKEAVFELEKKAGVKADAVRGAIRSIVDDRLRTDYKETSLDQKLISYVVDYLNDEYPSMSAAAVEILKGTDGFMVSNEKSRVIEDLKKKGYCDVCSRIALNIYEGYQVEAGAMA